MIEAIDDACRATVGRPAQILRPAAALAGIFVVGIAIWRERTYALSGPAVALCSLALIWGYALVVAMMAISEEFRALGSIDTSGSANADGKQWLSKSKMRDLLING